MTHDARPDLDQLELQAGQRPVGHRLGQFNAAQEGGQVVGQRVQLQPHLVVAELPARQPCPTKGMLAFLDVLLGGAALVVEPHDPVRVHGHVGDDEADTRKQLARMPFNLGDHPARLVPGRRLIFEVLVEALDLGQGTPPHGPFQPMRDLVLEHRVGGQPDGVEIACFFQPFVDGGDRVSRVRTKEPHDVTFNIPGNDGVEDVPPAIGAVDVAMAQGAAFQHAELVEQKVGVVAGAVEMPVPGRALLIAMGGADRAVHVQHDVLQPVTVMELVDPLPVQVGQRRPVLGQGQRLGLEPPHLRRRGSLRIDSPAAHDLTHHGIEGQLVGVVYILVPGQSPEHRLPEKAVKPMTVFLPRRVSRNAVVASSDSPSASSSSRITRRPPSELSWVPRNSSRTRRSKSTRSTCCEPAPSG